MGKRIIALLFAIIFAVSPCVSSLAAVSATGNVNTNTSSNDAVRNSINMLNYLAVTTVDINASQNGRLYLEEVYSSLINNTNPEAVDDRTQSYLNNLLQIIDGYRMIEVKRERLEYIYDKQKAAAIFNAVPNPLGLLSSVQSTSLKDIALSFVYMAVDSVSSYEKAIGEAEEEYLKSGWELDDQQQEVLNTSREAAFDYMIDITQKYGLKQENSLSEKVIQEFVEKKNLTNNTRRLEFFLNNQETYKDLGEYWLTLAEIYFEEEDYRNCIATVEKYKELEVGVLRKDYAYAKVLPLAVIAAEETYAQDEYARNVEMYIEEILENIDNDDWDLRYFVAQTYIDLYSRKKDRTYLQKAYDCVKSNVNELIDEQLQMNDTYLADVKEAPVPKGATDELKKEIKKYNNLLEKERKVELPPVSEPLMLNLDLLFSLAKEMGIDDSQKTVIKKMINPDNNPLFLSVPLDKCYSFEKEAVKLEGVVFEGGKITFPAKYISDVSAIKVSVNGINGDVSFEDWRTDTVKRSKIDKGAQRSMDSITATFTSATAKKYDYKKGDVVTVELVIKENADPCIVKFKNQPWEKGFFKSPIDSFVETN